MSKMKGYLAMAMGIALMAEQMPIIIEEEPSLIIEKRPPSGTREYFFNIEGVFSTDHMLKTDYVFKCLAINDKNAIKKFNKWRAKANKIQL